MDTRWGYTFLSPWIFGFVTLTIGPMVASLYISFTQYNVLSAPRFVGANNYAELLGSDRGLLAKAFLNAVYLAGIGVPLGIVSGLAVALLLNTPVRGLTIYRTLFYMPAVVPTVASTILWWWILSPDPRRGLFNAAWLATISQWLHLEPPGWLSVEPWAKPAIILMGLWGAGGGMVLWLAGLKGIPRSLYEAAAIDGASPKRQFLSVTVPHLTPIIFFNVVMGFIGALQEFDRIYVATAGGSFGPGDSLLTPVLYLFANGFRYFKMGYASALAWIFFIVILVLTLIQLKLAKRWVHYEGEK